MSCPHLTVSFVSYLNFLSFLILINYSCAALHLTRSNDIISILNIIYTRNLINYYVKLHIAVLPLNNFEFK